MGISPLGSELGYYQGGKDIDHYRDLKTILGSLNDPETTELLRESEDADRWSWGFLISGLALGVVTAIAIPPTKVLGVDLLDRAATGSFYAQFLMLPGALFRFDAEGRKFNAIQRYNRSVRKEETFNFRVSPLLFANAKRPGFGLDCRF